MLQATFTRACRVVDARDVLIIGNRQHRQLYLKQLPDLRPENLILEPGSRGTAPAIALTAALEAWKGRFGVIVTIPSDHIILDPDDWVAALKLASEYAAAKDQLVSIASIPDTTEVKFGYLVIGDRVGGTERNPVSRVVRFVEKPDVQTLESLVAGGRCLRHMGMIAFKPQVILAELARHVPEIQAPFENAVDEGFDEVSVDVAYSSMPKASIDATLLQRTDRLVAVASQIHSIDAGDFTSLGDILDLDAQGNRIKGRTVMIDSTSNIVFSDGATVAAVGIHDLVIVVDGETVLVCPKDQSQRIKEASNR